LYQFAAFGFRIRNAVIAGGVLSILTVIERVALRPAALVALHVRVVLGFSSLSVVA